ncbi:hypothetical protein [Sellimonas caecigallum]|uniref:Uncharacterized protein n=1 Tax=Sellimonas caecigallum TaxID=2592333 RepID=A0ABS7L7C0_9FIRM|nr:hypothetical protein [Sellimonas caecigallum]MBY0758929.1 hypothetical protein [Sellimonas caecigallum]
MTDKVKDGSRYNGSFQQEGRSVGSYFFRKSELRIFEKTDKMEMLTEGTLPEIFILSGGSTEGAALCGGECKGAAAPCWG